MKPAPNVIPLPPPPLRRVAGKPVPGIILGTASLGSVLPDALVSTGDRERAFRYLDSMLDLGCAAFDVAASYMLGGTERLIGQWMESRQTRSRLFLITKGGHPYPVVRPSRLNAADLTEDLQASLRRLRTEHIDLYLLHRDDPGAPLEPVLEMLLTYQRQGAIGAWGVSNWSHDRIRTLNALCRDAGVPPVAASSPHFSLASWAHTPWKGCVSIAGEAHAAARDFYRSTQTPVLAWSPLGRGFFSTGAPGETSRTYANAANLARKRRLEALAQKRQVSSAQLALAYVLNQPFPAFAIVSASTVEKMRENLEATQLRLTEGELSALESGDPADPRGAN